jgi:KDO2-lipid IV(A) lauroyltransferase
VCLEGEEHLRAVAGAPVILLVPHFVGMDIAWTRLIFDYRMSGMYSKQKNPRLDAILLKGRSRSGRDVTLARQDGIRPAVRAIREGLPFYYLPDMDFGSNEAIFVPFFGHPAATLTVVSRLARMCDARIIPCVNKMLPGGKGYVAKLYPAWDNFPGPNLEADARRMNEFIEERVKEMPEQYYWVHRRFKTRPLGEDTPY